MVKHISDLDPQHEILNPLEQTKTYTNLRFGSEISDKFKTVNTHGC